MVKIFWSTVCRNGSSDVFWDTDIALQTQFTDVTRCFQDTVLAWIPNLYVLTLGIIWIIILLQRKTIVHWNCSRFNSTKFALTVVLFFIYAMFIVIVLQETGFREIDHFLKYFMSFVSILMIAVIIKLELMKGVTCSGYLWTSWLLYLVMGAVEFRSRLLEMRSYNMKLQTLFYFAYGFHVAEFILALFPDNHRYVHRMYSTEQPFKSSFDPVEIPMHKQCPEETAGFFSRVTFLWTYKILWKAFQPGLTFRSLWLLRSDFKSINLVPEMEERLKENIKRANKTVEVEMFSLAPILADKMKRRTRNAGFKRQSGLVVINHEDLIDYRIALMESKISIMKLLMRSLDSSFLLAGVLKLLDDVTVFLLPLLVYQLVDFVQTKPSPAWLGYFYVFMLFVISVLRSFLYQNYTNRCSKVGMKFGTVCLGVIYRKAVKLTSITRKTSTVESLVDLVSVDAQRFNGIPMFIHEFWSIPLTTVVCSVILWKVLGAPIIAGVLFVLLIVIMNTYLAYSSKYQLARQIEKKVERVNRMRDVIAEYEVIKMYSWEDYFWNDIEKNRTEECRSLRSAHFKEAFSSISAFITPYCATFFTYGAIQLFSDPAMLDAKNIFVSLCLFHIFCSHLSNAPRVLGNLAQANISMERMKIFLLQDEVERYVEIDPNMQNALEMNEAVFSWVNNHQEQVLRFNLKVAVGQLVGVVGSLGAGKSSFLSAICGELNKEAGEVKVKGTIAYVPQQAWIQETTVRNNIIFTKPFNSRRYKQVLQACHLLKDIENLYFKDQTIIGVKGMNLNDSLKQRINLARALYQDADLYLFDEPLSAVDMQLANLIYKTVISKKGILKDKTRLLVTQNPIYLPKTDLVVVIGDGEISKMGPYEELLKDREFDEFIVANSTFIAFTAIKDIEVEDQMKLIGAHVMDNVEEADRQLNVIAIETPSFSKIKIWAFGHYLKAFGFSPLIMLLLSYSALVVSLMGGGVWLSEWSGDVARGKKQEGWRRLLTYGVYVGAQVLSVLGLSISLACGGAIASKRLHKRLLFSFAKAPTSYLDSVPLGRALALFQQDIGTIDSVLPQTFKGLLINNAALVVGISLISYSMPSFAIAIALLLICVFFHRTFMLTLRQLGRMETKLKAPVYSHFAETIIGLGVLRASSEVDNSVAKNDDLVDNYQICNFAIISVYSFLEGIMEFMGSVLMLLAGVFVVQSRDVIDPGLAGLSLVFALQMTSMMSVFMHTSAEMELQVASVERVHEIFSCPQEAAQYIYNKDMNGRWPVRGQVEIENLSVRYTEETPMVLKNVSLHIKAGDKVGVLGASLSGKSTLMLALLRVVEASTGRIVIDDKDISSLGLQQLRSMISTIPQKPVIFDGTLRTNLDPSCKYSEPQIWAALKNAKLHTLVSQLPAGLDTICSDASENFCMQNRLLICLARALLRRSKLLLVDQAAVFDLKMHEIVHDIIRKQFLQATVITIARHIKTVFDYEKIIVMEEGKVKEFDTVANLLADKQSSFYSMAVEAKLVK